MIATNALVQAMLDLLAADTATLGSVTAMKLHLAKNSFVPGPGLVLASLTPAAFTGSTAKSAGTGTQNVYFDPLTSALLIEILEPVGGWTWICTVDPATPGETIFGVYLTDNAGAVLYGAQLLPTPVLISAAGDGLNFSTARFMLALSPFGPGQ